MTNVSPIARDQLTALEFYDFMDDKSIEQYILNVSNNEGRVIDKSTAQSELANYWFSTDSDDHVFSLVRAPIEGHSDYRLFDSGTVKATSATIDSIGGSDADDIEAPTTPSLVFQEQEGDIPWSKTYKDKVNYFGGIASSVIDAGNPNLWRVRYAGGHTELMNWNPLNNPERTVNNAASEDAQLQTWQPPPGDAQVEQPTTDEVITQAQIDAANAEEARLAADRAKAQADREEEDRRNAQAEADNAAQQA